MKPIALVVWDDAHGNDAMFNDTDVDHKPYRFTSVGFLIRNDDIGISLAREFTEDGVCRDHQFIPRVLIVSMQTMKRTKKRVVKEVAP